MAIQVSGTEVISDARALTNITSIDATTAASISAEIAGIPTGVIAIWSGAVNLSHRAGLFVMAQTQRQTFVTVLSLGLVQHMQLMQQVGLLQLPV
jgi:hypothetical protein